MSFPPRPEVLFLDAGNTVVFLDHGVVSEVLAGHGEDADPDALRAAEGRAKRHYEQLLERGGSHEDGWGVLVCRMLVEAGIRPERADWLTARLRAVHDEHNLWRRVPEGLPEALERARVLGMRLAVISNSEGKLDALFRHLGLDRYFETVVDSALEGVSKPAPEIFHRAVRRMATRADRSCYVGDIPRVDVDGARGAGMHAILIDPFQFYADYTDAPRVTSVAELIERWT